MPQARRTGTSTSKTAGAKTPAAKPAAARPAAAKPAAARSAASKGTASKSSASRSSAAKSSAAKPASARTAASKPAAAKSSRSASARSAGTRSANAKAGTAAKNGASRSSASKGTPRVSIHVNTENVKVDAIAERLRKLNEKIIDFGREAGETTLTSYEKALKTIANGVAQSPAKDELEWITHLAASQAKFVREITDSWAKAARDRLK